MKFKPGEIVATRSIAEESSANPAFSFFVHKSIERHLYGDWGDACAEDKASNETALITGGRLFSVYKSEEFGVVWVITEWDRSVTTVLRPEDY